MVGEVTEAFGNALVLCQGDNLGRLRLVSKHAWTAADHEEVLGGRLGGADLAVVHRQQEDGGQDQ